MKTRTGDFKLVATSHRVSKKFPLLGYRSKEGRIEIEDEFCLLNGVLGESKNNHHNV